MTCTVIDRLQSASQRKTKTGICYIYCNYKRTREQDTAFFLASMLKSLVWNLPSLPQSLTELYFNYKAKLSVPSVQDYIKIFETLKTELSPIYILIDAIDECTIENMVRDKFLDQLFTIQSLLQAKLMVTSRFIPEIEHRFRGMLSYEIRASDQDIRKYIDGRLTHSISNPILQEESSQGAMASKIIQAAKGM